ncbi:MAG: hypothetical protein AB7O68_14645 [Pirellulales bacterium]
MAAKGSQKNEQPERREQALRQKFKLGLRRLCAKQFWKLIRQTVQTTVHEAIASEFALQREDVTKGLNTGALSLENLLLMLTCLDWQYADLPALPSYEERCLAGYAEAVESVLPRKPKVKQPARINLTTFVTVASLVSYRRFQLLSFQGQLTAEAWRQVIAEIRPGVVRRLGRANDDPTVPETVEEFQRLYQTWGEAVSRSILAIPNRWTDRWELSA